MKTEINFTTQSGTHYNVFVSATFKGFEFYEASKTVTGYVPTYRVYVKVDNKTTSFKFSGSIHDGQMNKTEMDEKDLQFALYCFISDACAGDQSFEDFCSEFGYDEDSRKAEKTYKACVKSKERAERMFDDIYEAANELNELANA